VCYWRTFDHRFSALIFFPSAPRRLDLECEYEPVKCGFHTAQSCGVGVRAVPVWVC
jgi:hypothetical protein